MPPEPEERRRPLRVALSPESPIVAAGVVAALDAVAPEIRVTHLADLSAVPLGAEVLLYDPQRHDAEEVARLSREARDTTLVAFSWSTRPDLVDEARRVGAAGYLSKELSGSELATAVRALRLGHRGRFVVLPYDAAPVQAAAPRPAGLTGRELEVLELIALGLSNDDISKRLYLSINSVKTYVRMAYRKIGATRRTQAVLWALQHEIVPVHGRE